MKLPSNIIKEKMLRITEGEYKDKYKVRKEK